MKALAKAPILFALLLTCWFGPSVMGQDSPPQEPAAVVPASRPSIFGIEGEVFPRVAVRLRLVSPQPLKVRPEDLALTEDGSSITAFSISPEKPRHFCAVVLDRSAGIAPALEALKESARMFFETVPSDLQVAVVAFGNDVEIVQGFTLARPPLVKAVQDLRPSGGCSLYDAIAKGCSLLQEASGRQDIRTLICLTSGRDLNPAGSGRFSIKTLPQAVGMCESERVRVITIGLGSGVDEKELRGISTTTRGGHFQAPSPDGLAGIFRALRQRLLEEQFFSLGYQSPNPSKDGSRRTVQVGWSRPENQEKASGSYLAPNDASPADDPSGKATPGGKKPLVAQPMATDGTGYFDGEAVDQPQPEPVPTGGGPSGDRLPDISGS